MITIVTTSKKVFDRFVGICNRLNYIDIINPTYDEETGRRTARMGTAEDALKYHADKKKGSPP